jgi:hypothetical protein
MGAAFLDAGAASNRLNTLFPFLTGSSRDPDYGAVKAGAGYGLRMNLFGGFVVKWDHAWRLGRTNPHEDYVSLGAEF